MLKITFIVIPWVETYVKNNIYSTTLRYHFVNFFFKEFYQRKIKVKFVFSRFLQVWRLLYWMAFYMRLVAQMGLLLWLQWRSLIRNQTSGYLFVPWEPRGNILELQSSKVQYMQVRYSYAHNIFS